MTPTVRVLPRPARLAYRYCAKIIDGGAALPRHLGSALATGFFAATIGYGALVGGHLDGAISSAGAKAGFSVGAITITGANRTTRTQIIEALALDGNASAITLDVADARERIAGMPWIASVSVAKAYPDAVRVDLVEKQAAAIWQEGDRMLALDGDGGIIGPASLAADRRLPAFVGIGADKAGLAFSRHIAQAAPGIAAMVRAHVLVAERRWDLVLDNGVTVRLPETGVEEALSVLALLDAETELLSRDIVSVDLRNRSRIALGLGETARAALDERFAKDAKS